MLNGLRRLDSMASLDHGNGSSDLAPVEHQLVDVPREIRGARIGLPRLLKPPKCTRTDRERPESVENNHQTLLKPSKDLLEPTKAY